MEDIDIRILRPVALPRRFFGAPEVPAVINVSFCMMVFCAMIVFRVKINSTVLLMAALLAMFICHVLLIQLGSKDPHLSSLIQTLRIARRKPRGIGRARRKVYHP